MVLGMKSQSSTRQLLQITNNFLKVIGYKINLQKSSAFLNTNIKHAEDNIVEAV